MRSSFEPGRRASMPKGSTVPSAVAGLASYFERNGYVRQLNPERRSAEGQRYKKGDEVRLVANSRAELAHIRRLLRQARFPAGRPFVKGGQFRQPIYGRQEVARFLALVGAGDTRVPDVRTPQKVPRRR
jgi:hypothetical protein